MQNRQFLEALTARLGPWLWSRPVIPRPSVTRLAREAEEWRPLLAPERYAVLFEREAEPPFTSPLLREKRAGTYLCAACYLPLFDGRAKFDSRTGWVSFWEPLPGHVETREDLHEAEPRTEYHCAHCGGHQGFVYADGPPPTGLRYSNHGLGLRFVPQDEPLPELRT